MGHLWSFHQAQLSRNKVTYFYHIDSITFSFVGQPLVTPPDIVIWEQSQQVTYCHLDIDFISNIQRYQIRSIVISIRQVILILRSYAPKLRTYKYFVMFRPIVLCITTEPFYILFSHFHPFFYLAFKYFVTMMLQNW